MTIRSHTLIAALLIPAFSFPALGSPTPREVPVAAEMEEWELEPNFEVEAPSEEDIDRLVREGGTLRVVIDGVVYEEVIAPPSGKALGKDDLRLMERDIIHQERLVTLLEKATRDPAAAERELVEYTRKHRADLRAAVTARPALMQRLLHDEAGLLSVPDGWLERLGQAFSRSVVLIAQAGAWLDRPAVLAALQAFTLEDGSSLP